MALAKKETGLIEEMSIVDVFTRLIFDAETVLDETETLVVDCLVHIDNSLLGAPRRDISEFLRHNSRVKFSDFGGQAHNFSLIAFITGMFPFQYREQNFKGLH